MIDTKPFRILSLDGGGVKGAFTASFLATIEDMTKKSVADYFDLITGTSTGGIIAIGLGLGISAGEICEFYRENGPKIFPSMGIIKSGGYFLRNLFRPKYETAPLMYALQEVFKNNCLGNSKKRLVIPSYDAVRGDVHLIKTAHHEKFKQDYKMLAWEAAMATSAAPTFFQAYQTSSKLTFIDGGVWANNPVMVGIVEAQTILSQNLQNISVLSIGTTESPLLVSKKCRQGGPIIWRKAVVDLILQAQSKAALAQSDLLLNDRILRVNPTVNDGEFSLDKAESLDDLIALGAAEARHREKEISLKYLSAIAETFVPCYSL